MFLGYAIFADIKEDTGLKSFSSRQLSGSCQAVVRQLSGSLQSVVRLSLSDHSNCAAYDTKSLFQSCFVHPYHEFGKEDRCLKIDTCNAFTFSYIRVKCGLISGGF
jgi:hypothetical protein